MIICIGPFCVPLWHLGVLLLMLLQPLIRLFRLLFKTKEKKEKEEGESEETAAAEAEAAAAAGDGSANGVARRRPKSAADRQVLAVHTAEELQAVKDRAAREGQTLFIDFNASWCYPCKRIKPVFQRLSEEYEGLFVSVDVEEVTETLNPPGALPTFRVYKNGRVVEDLTGAFPSKLEDLVRRHCS